LPILGHYRPIFSAINDVTSLDRPDDHSLVGVLSASPPGPTGPYLRGYPITGRPNTGRLSGSETD
jgi:hypothetical protein